MRISDEIVQQVRESNDIIDVLEEYLTFKRNGDNYLALCPFHSEKTPSFVASRKKQIFKCFGCGESGNVISFVMKYKNLNFVESIKFLASKVGIEVDSDVKNNILDEYYNILVDCFKTGKDPKVPTQTYSMTQGNNFTYGIQPGQPKKPIQSASELTDECISGWMLGLHKQGATGKVAAALEATNPVVRRVLADSIPNCIEMAYELSIYQNKHQYYQVPQLSQNDMNAIVNSYAETQSQGMQH